MLASALGIEALDHVALVPGVPERMEATELVELVVDAAMAHVVALGHDTADTKVIPAGMPEAAGNDHVSGEPMAPERITGPPVLLEPMATQTPDEGQATWESDEVVLGTESRVRVATPTAPE